MDEEMFWRCKVIVIQRTLLCHRRQCSLEPCPSSPRISHTSVSPMYISFIFFFSPFSLFFHFNFLPICWDLSQGLVFQSLSLPYISLGNVGPFPRRKKKGLGSHEPFTQRKPKGCSFKLGFLDQSVQCIRIAE